MENCTLLPLLEAPVHEMNFRHIENKIQQLKNQLGIYKCKKSDSIKLENCMFSGLSIVKNEKKHDSEAKEKLYNFETHNCDLKSETLVFNEIEISSSAYFRKLNLNIDKKNPIYQNIYSSLL